MKLCIVGAGGVGGYLAAMLARAGEELYLAARGENKDAIERNGIIVNIAGGTFGARVKEVSDDPADFGEGVDAVLLCTKGYDLAGALEAVSPIVGSRTLLVPFGNGVGNAARVERRYPDNPVANGAIYIVSHLVEPGVVEVKGKGAYVVIGCDGKLPEPVRKLGRVLENAGIKTKVSDNITTEVWKKYLLISAMATLTSFHDEPMGAVVQNREDELRALLGEIMAVGRAEGAKLDEKDIERVVEQIGKVPYDSPTSMWLDFRAKRRSELEELSGYVAKRAQELGIAVPVMRSCYEELKGR